MKVSLLLVFLDSLLWLILFLTAGLRFDKSSETVFELKRRKLQGDKTAADMLDYQVLIPRFETMRYMLAILLVTICSTITAFTYGWLVGALASAFLVLLLGVLSRSRHVASLSQYLFSYVKPWLLSRIAGWHWLDFFATYRQPETEHRIKSKEELSDMVERSRGILTNDERLRFESSLSMSSRQVSDIMTQLSVIDTANLKDVLGPLVIDDLHKTGHSRFPVVQDDINHIAGILYLRDLVDIRTTKKTVREAMEAHVYYIHQDQTLERALHGFLKTHRHLFIVVNDYRETVGIVTLEDVVEALLGKKIVDEFDRFEDLRAVAESKPTKNN